MKKIEATRARQEFSDTVNRVAYGGDRIVLSRHGKDLAALVPVEDLDLIERCEEAEALQVVARGERKGRTPPARKPRKS